LIHVIILDFDGVILESVSAKTEAFASLFRGEDPVDVEYIVSHHVRHNGISRFDKIKHYYKDILKKDLDKDGLNRLCQRFSDLTVQAVLDSPFVEGAQDFINRWSQTHKLYIASGTPENEMKDIVKRLGLAHKFDGIYGSPEKKWTIAEKILGITHCSPIAMKNEPFFLKIQ